MCNCNKIIKKIKCKRYFLPLIFVVTILPFIEQTQTFIYFPIIIGFSSLIFFWNFPWIVYYTASKPLYYEDLFIDVKQLPNYEVDIHIKHKFNTILLSILVITNSILMGVLTELWVIRTDKKDGFLNSLAITGGIIKIFQIVNNTISRIMLKILRKFIIKQSNQIRQEKIQKIKELVNLKQIETFEIKSDGSI